MRTFLKDQNQLLSFTNNFNFLAIVITIPFNFSIASLSLENIAESMKISNSFEK
jgi:hypothetical protein